MIKLSLETFIEQAKKAKKFDPQWTVDRVRRERIKIEKKPIINNTTLQDTIEDTIENTEVQTNNRETQTITPEQTGSSMEPIRNIVIENDTGLSVLLPDSLKIIQQILTILKENQGTDYNISV